MGVLGTILAPIVERLLKSLLDAVLKGLGFVVGKGKTEVKVFKEKKVIDKQIKAMKKAEEEINDGKPATPEQRAEKYRRLRDLANF